MIPARLAIHECRMQFPQHRAAPRNHTVGIATLTHTIENSPNRIARKTTPSARTSTYVGPTACAWARSFARGFDTSRVGPLIRTGTL